MSLPYNRIVLIGNGFDRAAGLKTSYSSFITQLVKNAAIEVYTNGDFESKLFSLKRNNIRLGHPLEKYLTLIEATADVSDLLEITDRISTQQYNFEFIKQLVRETENDRWVDIEQYYYDTLKTLYSAYKSKPSSASKIALLNIVKMNECMDHITNELNNYIYLEQNSKQASLKKSPLISLIKKTQAPLKKDIANLVARHKRREEPEDVVFVNFNYTSTIQTLANTTKSIFNPRNRYINIHGEVNSLENPIIFGYGDDTGEEYLELETEGINALLNKIKSFHYPRTKNYHNLLNVLEGNEFDVFILGHSCGLSDRTLLKTIFEHKNCMAIQNFHYKGENEDFNKRMELSRHFSDKALMRERILPYDESAVIPQINR